MKSDIPLCVDLDHTLFSTDLLHETFVEMVGHDPVRALGMMSVAWRGRAQLKFFLAEHSTLKIGDLPTSAEVLALATNAAESGRSVWLATAAAPQVAARVACQYPWISGVVSSTRDVNLKGVVKARALTDKFGTGGFDYVGDSPADDPVFDQARWAYLATANGRRARRFRRRANGRVVMLQSGRPIAIGLRAIRVHQWAKNTLIGVPLILSQLYDRPTAWLTTALAFISFSLCASSVYLLNDIVDLGVDRAHETKRRRPLASGQLSIPRALLMALCLITGSFTLAICLLPLSFAMVLFGYFLTTALYSFWLKGELVVDVVCLALLYTVRIIAGTVAIGAAESHWLLAFSMFIFMSLAMVKRSAELFRAKRRGLGVAGGRAYAVDDLGIIQCIGVSAGLVAALVCVLYVDSTLAQTLYHRPNVLIAVVPILLYWIARVWVLAARGQVVEDPVIWALKDRASHIVLVLIGLLLFFAK